MPLPKIEPVPTFYKYRSMATPDERDRLRDIIQNNRFWWSNPDAFNDPFDCLPRWELPNDREYLILLKHVVRRQYPGLPRRDRQRHFRRLNIKDRPTMEQFQAGMAELMRESAVLSLSTDPTTVLLWSHYADCHRGICLEVWNEPDGPLFPHTYPVAYTAHRPVVRIRDDEIDNLLALAFTKADFWGYEQEWRALDYRGGRGLRAVNPEMMRSIIFGIQTPEDHRQMVIDWNAARPRPMALKQAYRDDNDFRINIRPL